MQELRALARESVIDSGLNISDEASLEISEQGDDPEELPQRESLYAQPRQISMDFTELQKINGDIIGWLYAEGTKIDNPVVLTDNNTYYLNHLYSGEVNGSGSLFADFRNHRDFSDKNTVIYGHHMRNGSMFGSIEEYRSQDFYESAPTMMLYTPEGDYLIELISGTDESGNDQFVKFEFENDKEFEEYIDSFRERSTFKSDVEVRPQDKLISLCTCTYVFNNARYMLIGRLVEIFDTEDTDQKMAENAGLTG